MVFIKRLKWEENKMDYILENEKIRLKTVSAGAEMKSLVRKSDGQEILWEADPKFWGRTAPVLFPLVGKVKDDSYIENGKKYELHQHGFARDMEFEIVSKSDTSIVYLLKSNDNTLKVYPYKFELYIAYIIDGSKVNVEWKVVNPSDETIYFSIGGHPAFACPLDKKDEQSDYSFVVECEENKITCDEFCEGYVTGEKYFVELDNKRLPISRDLFDRDALVIENRQAGKVSLLDSNGNKYLTVSFEAPVFGLWSPPKKNAPFVCIEPWYGRCDNINYKGEWKNREWGNKLKSGDKFIGGYKIEVI